MDLYTMTPGFLRDQPIEKFLSVIWTDRYATPGDVTLSLADTPEARALIPEGTLLNTPDSTEVMLVDSVLTQDGVLKATGSSLLGFLNERIFRTSPSQSMTSAPVNGNSTGQVIGNIVNHLVHSSSHNSDPSLSDYGLDDAHEEIPNLTLGAIDTSSVVGTALYPYPFPPPATIRKSAEALPFGPMLDVLLSLSQPAKLGMSLYLDSASLTGYSLKFKVYSGLDRTSDQSVNEVVRFSPKLDNLRGVSELYSSKGYKTVAYAFCTVFADPSRGSGLAYIPAVAYAGGVGPTTMGFARRSLMVPVSELTQEDLAVITTAQLSALLQQRATDALANNNYTRVIDGEVVPQGEFKYGVNYGLGDVIELQSPTGVIQKARVTEFIRSQDSTGERAYPTVSVVD